MTPRQEGHTVVLTFQFHKNHLFRKLSGVWVRSTGCHRTKHKSDIEKQLMNVRIRRDVGVLAKSNLRKT